MVVSVSAVVVSVSAMMAIVPAIEVQIDSRVSIPVRETIVAGIITPVNIRIHNAAGHYQGN
jgi:hypothetical protein